MNPTELEAAIFNTPDAAEALALDVYRLQYSRNAVYRKWCDLLNRAPAVVKSKDHIPYLPIELFKSHRLDWDLGCPENEHHESLIFRSSGTTGQKTSEHVVRKPSLYHTSFTNGFEHFYGPVNGMRILALLPGYLERRDSSLVYMVQRLMEQSGHPDNGFFLSEVDQLCALLQKKMNVPTLLIGVSFALLDLAESHPMPLHNTLVMETGGMKGRRREPTREELHSTLKGAFAVQEIHSEYGMTELLSQAYAKKEGRFNTPPWMALHIRDANDPMALVDEGRTGGINVVDLANLYSCSFIATSDLGRRLPDGSIEILGRMDYSDMRGCNLMVSNI